VGMCGINFTYIKIGPVANSCQHSNEPSGSISWPRRNLVHGIGRSVGRL